MPKLHEGLAIHKDRVAVTRKVFEEATKVFKANAHFRGFVKITSYIDEADARFNKTEEKRIDETVPSKLDYVNDHFAKLLDLDYQMEIANKDAVADFVIDGQVIASNVPVNFLLTIENKFRELRDVLNEAPTHAPGIAWSVDREQNSNGEVYRAGMAQVEYLTKKVPVYTTIAAATEHHPAQVAASHDDKRVAIVTTTHFASTISPAEKSDMLGRCDKIIIAAKRARQRANNVNLPSNKVASAILDYVVRGRDVAGVASSEPEEI